jgi:hypothetical protein
MLITKIYLAAMSRADASPALMRTLPQFYLYVDEFQSFANESFADILSEARKYKLNLTMAHQYIEQMEEEVRAAVFGNVGTMIVFRVGAYDAEVLEKEFMPTFTAEDIVNLGVYQIYLKLMIDGVSSQPFSAVTLPPIALPPVSPAEEIKAMSRQQFAHTRADVEKAINEWMSPIKAAPIKAVSPVPKPPAPIPIPSLRLQPSSGASQSRSVQPNPSVSASSLRTQAPKPQPAPAKPFATALKTMEKDSIPARAKQIEQIDEDLPKITLVKDPNKPKSVPLSSLSPSASKVPTPERVSALKAALAKAMAKPVNQSSASAVVDGKVVELVPEDKEDTSPSQIPEVPEDILKKVLKVD